MRALVISGGGCKGAFAGGVAEYLINARNIEYDMYTGSSTGALLVPLLAAGKIDRAKEVYTNVSQKKIFSRHPFFVRKKHGKIVTKINHWGILKMFISGKNTFGESKSLRKLIAGSFLREDYEKIKASDKKVAITVSNFTRNRVEHKYLRDHDYEDFIDWIWISANFVPFMSLVIKNDQEYADGGFGNFIPLREAIDMGATEIDTIVLSARRKSTNKVYSKNAFEVMMSSLDFMLAQIAKDEKYIGLLESIQHDLKIRYFHTPRNLTDNSLYFNPALMKQWWQEGYEHAHAKITSDKNI